MNLSTLSSMWVGMKRIRYMLILAIRWCFILGGLGLVGTPSGAHTAKKIKQIIDKPRSKV